MSLLTTSLALALVVSLTPPEHPHQEEPPEEDVVATVSEDPPIEPGDLEPPVPQPPATSAPPTSTPAPTGAPNTTALVTTTGSTSTTEASSATTVSTDPPISAVESPLRAVPRNGPVVPEQPPDALALSPDDDNWGRWYAVFAGLVAASMILLAGVRSRRASTQSAPPKSLEQRE